MALKVAQSDVGVMISGESGTGKEVLAHFIRDHSTRKKNHLLRLIVLLFPNRCLRQPCLAMKKGFTGAYKSTAGKFEQAQGGTLLF